MEELKKLLAQTDEEYLIGLSNKGTVKRAYKDLEQESPSVVWEGEEAEVALKEAVCRIRVQHLQLPFPKCLPPSDYRGPVSEKRIGEKRSVLRGRSGD